MGFAKWVAQSGKKNIQKKHFKLNQIWLCSSSKNNLYISPTSFSPWLLSLFSSHCVYLHVCVCRRVVRTIWWDGIWGTWKIETLLWGSSSSAYVTLISASPSFFPFCQLLLLFVPFTEAKVPSLLIQTVLSHSRHSLQNSEPEINSPPEMTLASYSDKVCVYMINIIPLRSIWHH